MKIYLRKLVGCESDTEYLLGIDTEEASGHYHDLLKGYANRQTGLKYVSEEREITFMWNLMHTEFQTLMLPPDEDADETYREYLGAVFFGNFKLEFVKTDTEPYCNCFQYGADDKTRFSPYDHLADGTPYEEREEEIAENIRIIKRRTFEAFAKNIEDQIIKLLNRYPEYIDEATQPTDPDKWYPERTYYHTTIIRVA